MPLDSAVGGDDVLLVGQGLPHDESGVLDDDGGVAEDKIDGAGDDAVGVELAVGLGVECVLVAFHFAVVEGRSV